MPSRLMPSRLKSIRLLIAVTVACGSVLFLDSTVSAQNAQAERLPDMLETLGSEGESQPHRTSIELDTSPLVASEQLALVISRATDSKGKPSRVIVFLGRSNNDGWQAIGAKDKSELRRHWLTAAARRLPGVDFSLLNDEGEFAKSPDSTNLGLRGTSVQKAAARDKAVDDAAVNNVERDRHRKILLSVELSVQRFLRAYEQVQSELAEQLNDDTQTVDLTNHKSFVELRNLGMHGLFDEDSLTARVIRSTTPQ